MAKMRFNRNFSITRVVSKLVYTVLALYVGGTIMVVFGDVMNGTYSPFYQGLSLIGWTVNATSTECGDGVTAVGNCIIDTSGAGVLAVLGIIAIAGVVLEFIRF